MRSRKKRRVIAEAITPESSMTQTKSTPICRAGPSTRSSTASIPLASSTRKAVKPRRAVGKKRGRARKVDVVDAHAPLDALSTAEAALPTAPTFAAEVTPEVTPSVAPPTNLPTTTSVNQPEPDAEPTPPALQRMLDQLRVQYLSMLEYMKTSSYVEFVKHQITIEQERKQRYLYDVERLDSQISYLSTEGVSILKNRMRQLGVDPLIPGSLVTRANHLVGEHKGLQSKAQKELQAVEILEKALVKKLTAQNRMAVLSDGEIRTPPDKPPAMLVQPFQLTHATPQHEASVASYYHLLQYQQDAQAHYAKMGSLAVVDKVPPQPSESSSPNYAAQAPQSGDVDLANPDKSSTVANGVTTSSQMAPSN